MLFTLDLKKYRSRTDIVAQILSLTREGPATKTRIMYAVFLSYAQLKEYLSLLLESGLLEFSAVDRTYRTTKKGIEFLHSYEKMSMLSGAERAS